MGGQTCQVGSVGFKKKILLEAKFILKINKNPEKIWCFIYDKYSDLFGPKNGWFHMIFANKSCKTQNMGWSGP